MKNKNKIMKGCALALIPTSVCSAMAGLQLMGKAYAQSSYVNSYNETVTVTNSSFKDYSTPYSSGNSFTGWNAIEEQSNAFGAIINTDSTFSSYQSKFHLDSNPGTYGKNDTNVLMINSIDKNGNTQNARKGYRSSSITLQANSYYKFSVAIKTALNSSQAGQNVYASIYLSGIKDKDDESKELTLKYEGLSNTTWQEVDFFVATGSSSQTITLDLYLGSNTNVTSVGAVFFDEIQGTRYSQNEFYSEIAKRSFSGDNYETSHSSTSQAIFLVDALQEGKSYIANIDDYNFDFENPIIDETDTLGDEFLISNKSKGHAIIQDILNMQPKDFKEITGYDYVGTDLSKDNSQALILYTGEKVDGKTQTASGYVNVESKEISINAHAIYKISLKVKVSEIEEGAFFLNVKENDNILSTYSNILTDNENDKTKTLYTLNSGKSSEITSNTTNSFENDYQTISFYVKGHSLYNSSINLELCLGDEENLAKGCVVVDSISVEYASYTDYSSSTDKLELTSTLASDKGITNGRFDSSENEDKNENYLVKASSWTTQTDDNCDSGIIYLYDEATYENMYASNKDKYPWAGIFPASMTSSSVTVPNNVYLMNNRTSKGTQSISSSTFTLTKGGYHKISFSYYNQNGASSKTQSKIKVEVIDENGETLFSKNTSSLDKWSNYDIYLHTHDLLSHVVQIKITLENEGLVYLDDFTFSTSDDFANKFESANNKVDLTKLGLNENASQDLSLSSFYTFSDGNEDFTSPITTSGRGGIIDGRNNSYVESNEKLKVDGNYYVLGSRNVGYVKMTSKYTLSFDEGSYYKIGLDLATIFNSSALTSKTKEHDCQYGISIEIDGFEAVSGLLSPDEFKSLEIFYKATSSDTPNLVIKLVTDCEDTFGTALISNLTFQTVEEHDYQSALTTSDTEHVFVAKNNVVEDEDEDEDSDSSDSDTDSSSSDNTWLIVPSLITGVALILAVIGYALRQVKIKKIEKVRKESYDRKLAVNHDAILVVAQKRRDEELKDLNKAKELLMQEKEDLEKEYSDFIKSTREKEGNNITRGMERAFKVYTNKINRLNEKINIISEKIDYTASAEYLLIIERKILAEQDENADKKKKK